MSFRINRGETANISRVRLSGFLCLCATQVLSVECNMDRVCQFWPRLALKIYSRQANGSWTINGDVKPCVIIKLQG